MDKIISKKYNIFILAAGTGKRMGKIGKNNPKCLLKINKICLIDYLINFLINKKFKEINIVVGFKYLKIKKYLHKYKDIKIKNIFIKNYRKNGHSMSWYNFRKVFYKNKKNTIMIHADSFFEKMYFENIIKSKFPDIIGVKNIKSSLNKEAFYVKEEKNYVSEIQNKNLIKKPQGIIIGLNKISYITMNKIFIFMNIFFKKEKNKRLSWEIVLNEFIKKRPKLFKILKKQNFKWVNINKKKDLLLANKLSKKRIFV